MYYTTLSTPLGTILIRGDDQGISGIAFADEPLRQRARREWERNDRFFNSATEQLQAYFTRSLTVFDLPVNPSGTMFQRQVWQALRQLPFGETASYAEIARRLGNPKAVRAVGAANGQNPIAIVVPCHRVIGSNGTLTGYAGGLERKRWLLDHEAQVTQPGLFQ